MTSWNNIFPWVKLCLFKKLQFVGAAQLVKNISLRSDGAWGLGVGLVWPSYFYFLCNEEYCFLRVRSELGLFPWLAKSFLVSGPDLLRKAREG